MVSKRLLQQVEFINEIEKLKLVYRANMTLDPNRPENSAEHSWHITLMAVLFSEHAASNTVDLLKVVKMLLIHDLVEIDVGDTWLYSDNRDSKSVDELKCAQRVFGLLPEDQTNEMLELWHEFEAKETDEAKFASVIDGLHPLINHLLTGDPNSEETKISVEKVRSKKAYIKDFAPDLWELTESLINDSTEMGLYN